MNKFPKLFVVATSLVIGIFAVGVPCPNSPGFRLSNEAKEKCEEKIEESFEECRNFVTHLQEVKKLTDQKRFDLATALMVVSWPEADTRKQEQLQLRSLMELRELNKRFPDDVQVMYDLSVLEDNETQLNLRRNVSALAPDCTTNNYWFVWDLDRRTNNGYDRSEQDPSLVAELASLIDQGYEYAELRWYKIYFGHLKYREFVLQDELSSANQFRNKIVAELEPGSFPFQEDPTSDGWTLLCGRMGYSLRFAEICLDTIERALNGELQLENGTFDYAYSGVHLLSSQLTHGMQGVLNPGPPSVHESSYTPYTASEGARILMWLRDIMDSVPEKKRSPAYHRAYTKIVRKKPRIELPDEVEILNFFQ